MLSQGAIEQSVLSLLCFSEEHSPLLALKLSDSKLFSNRTHQLLARTALDYIQKYNQPPKGALEFLLEHEFKRGDEGKLLRQTFEDLSKQNGHIDATFIFEQLDAFLERQLLTTTLQNALDLLQEGEVEQAKESIFRVSSSASAGSPGLWMKDPAQALKFLERDEHTEFFSSGIPILDQRYIRPDRKTLMFIIASTGKGKTWWLINVGKGGLQYHKKVLHITLELDEEKTAARYIQAMFSLTKREVEQIRVAHFLRSTDGGGASIEIADLRRDPIISQQAQIKERLTGWFSCPQWHIKQFPTGTLSVEQLSLYLDSIEKRHRFRPDLVIIDYADIMRIDSQNLRIDTGRLYRDLRGVAIIKDFAMVSATQGNRESELAKLVGTTNIAEDWSKAGTADTILTYSQTPDEKRLGLARISVPKARDEQDGYLCMISQAYSIGQFCIDSVTMNTELANQIQSL